MVILKSKKQKFHQHKRPVSITNIDIDKTIVSNKVSLVKKDLNILLTTKMLKKLDLYVYFSQNWVYIEKTLMKLNTYLF